MVFSYLEEGFLPKLLLRPEGIFLLKTTMMNCHQNLKKLSNSGIVFCRFSMQRQKLSRNILGASVGRSIPPSSEKLLRSGSAMFSVISSNNCLIKSFSFQGPILTPTRFWGVGDLQIHVSSQRVHEVLQRCRGGQGIKVKSSHPSAGKASILWCCSIRRERC